MPPARRLAACADDFGSSPSICAAIVELAAAARLNAVSCITTAPPWRAWAGRLTALPPAVERGLHFNLTEGQPLAAELQRLWPRFPTLHQLLGAAMLRRLPLAAIAAEWRAQWRCFEQAAGRRPDFVDGHQHVHQLPGVRDIVLDSLAQQAEPIAVRNTARLLGPGGALKRAVIRFSGGAALEAELQRRGVPHNRLLLGAYDFHERDYRGLMRRWLAQAARWPAEGGLLFCHPGGVGDDADPIAPARRREAAYLGSDAYAADLQEAGVSLGPVWCRRSSAD